jgi:hypothetical protein
MPVRAFLLLTLMLAPSTFLSAQAKFPDQCNGSPIPFSAIEVKRPIDSTCGIKGKSTASQPSQLQNQVKNNLCAGASGNAPEEITVQTLVDLQANTHVPSGQGKEPTDRSALTALGEGKLVRIKAYLDEAHFADLGSGETVNCNGATTSLNDIHMALLAAPDAQECESVSAEILPHYRPDTWNQIGNDETYNSSTKKYTSNPAVDSRLKAHPYRITGQLFFDASHQVCPCGTKCSPIRASLWEIHPVYGIEVCKAGTTCDENNDSDWLAFDKWWNSMTPIKPSKGAHTHANHEVPSKKGGT